MYCSGPKSQNMARLTPYVLLSQQAFGLTSTSRLGCQVCIVWMAESILTLYFLSTIILTKKSNQVVLTEKMHDIHVKLPAATRNFYVDVSGYRVIYIVHAHPLVDGFNIHAARCFSLYSVYTPPHVLPLLPHFEFKFKFN